MTRKILLILALLICVTGLKAQTKQTFTNPLLPSGADPWAIYHNGYYYYTHTLGTRIALWKTKDLSALKDVAPKTIWTPPAAGPNSAAIWAPELHLLDNKWYIYYTATDKANKGDANRYVFVLENTSADPLEGTWVDKGKVNTGYSGLDGSVFEHRGIRYFMYSAYVGPQSVLVIAKMKNPWTLEGTQAIIASPTLPWEKFGGREILEGPEFLAGKKDEVFIAYSASACWADEYALGMLVAKSSADLLDPHQWTKLASPVFRQSPEHNVFATGHNAFVVSADGKEHWILYHANTGAGQGCDHRRSPRLQQFLWKEDGRPDFGVPVKIDSVLTAPTRND
ncbi:glycoside hydrolase family 43 protein [Fulvivirgaceae bacterium PWU4]|uniref:Glycoside hydrolase family 43 protein n=1 Tax=Chryseosolibacter histidini TaxID=2782349 RepID=A0AAP2GMR5_9BACT|nr:glycoside hydrolase family 43 protein [Chryseosolibacter histidini]MBT1696100.1 glycoside hydrolase family 43 protein [Chryseosolibacter histidini]